MTDRKNAKKRQNYICDFCDFLSCNKTDYTRHLATDKHKILTDTDAKTQKNAKNYNCDCGAAYKHRQSLLNHKKRCPQSEEPMDCLDNQGKINKQEELVKYDGEVKLDEEEVSFKQMFLEMVHQNKELQKTIQEQSKTIQEIIPKVGSNNNNSSINVTFNSLTMLNDSCKDALSMNEFINSIEVDIKDLINTSENGLATGLTNLFLENYNKLPLQKRPLWCVDKKRKKMYIKDDEEWHEDTNNMKTKAAIKTLTSIQARSSGKYIKENPDWMEHDKKKERFVKIVKQTTEDIDEHKQTHIINNLLDNLHLTDSVKDKLKNGLDA